MPTYFIVDKDTDPLGPNEIAAGATIQVNEGDIFVVTATANANTKFESATGTATHFEIQLSETLPDSFELEVRYDLTADVTVAAGVDVSGIHVKAGGSDGIHMSVGDGATVGRLTGSSIGADTVTVGNAVTWIANLDLGNGDNTISIGNDNVFLSRITTGNGADSFTAGDANSFAGDIDTGDGTDSFTAGDANSFAGDIDTGDGTDTVDIGDDNTISLLWTGNDADTATIGVIDTSVAQVIDGVGHTGSDGNPANDDTLSVALTPADQALLEAELLANGYIQTGKVWAAGPGADYHLHVNNVEISDWENIRVVCFTAGTLIDTVAGPRPVESLRPGDMVLTADNGPRPLRWMGRRRVPARGHLAPIRIDAMVLGNRRPLTVSPQHRMLLSDGRLEMYFASTEMLAPAKGLIGVPGLRCIEGGEVDYYHLLFDRHEIVFAEGAPSESLYLPSAEFRGFGAEARAEIAALFPGVAEARGLHGAPARRTLRVWEAALAAAITGLAPEGRTEAA